MKNTPPPLKDIFAVAELVSPTWAEWFTNLGIIAGSVANSGTTADRPTKGLFVGMPYFDKALGIPIWLKSVRPTVWVNSAGTSV